ncbi:MAG: siroheme synthase CysG [Rhizobiaceae bacterium]|jgi:uroporphyrin-III C-methyltransferase/precorrin-2 dehydrogenase/sirohydrochlorin ferrochelatase|nr:siroheme synthase CysG [Rhizobiaceae bacterium]
MSSTAPLLSAFPLFMRTSGRVALVVGNGAEAVNKARLLLASDVAIRLVADAPEGDLAALVAANAGRFTHVADRFHSAHLDGIAFAYAASGEEAADIAVVAAARAAGVPVNAVDRPELCDFYTPALVNRAPVAVAIGTEGAGPVLGQTIRAEIERMLAPNLGRLADMARLYRKAAEALVPRGEPRRRFWRAFFSGEVAADVARGELPLARRAATRLLKTHETRRGHVALVGAGPGAADLLTLRAQRLLLEADVIVHDALVGGDVIALGRRDAERIAVGKRKGAHSASQDEINAILVRLGREGKRVVRLKGGDPMTFGRAFEELEALRGAGISFEIVPGVTSASAAAADMALPMTLRGVASSIVFTTGHDLKGGAIPDWAGLALKGATVGLYMGRSVATTVAERLIGLGLSPKTPVAIIENASLIRRRILSGTLGQLSVSSALDGLDGPTLVFIGKACAKADLAQAIPLSTLRAAKPGRAALESAA